MKVFLFLCLSFSAYSQVNPKVTLEYDPGTDLISEKYDAGSYLIYDCEENHWVCVLEVSFKECGEKRKASRETGRNPACAPIGEFPNKKSCFQRALFMTSNAHGARFCLGDRIKEKSIRF